MQQQNYQLKFKIAIFRRNWLVSWNSRLLCLGETDWFQWNQYVNWNQSNRVLIHSWKLEMWANSRMVVIITVLTLSKCLFKKVGFDFDFPLKSWRCITFKSGHAVWRHPHSQTYNNNIVLVTWHFTFNPGIHHVLN